MRHLVVLYKPTVIGPSSYSSLHFVSPKEGAGVYEIPSEYKKKIENYEQAQEALVLANFKKQEAEGLTIDEFAIGEFAALSAYFYNEADTLEVFNRWEFDRALRTVFERGKRIPDQTTLREFVDRGREAQRAVNQTIAEQSSKEKNATNKKTKRTRG